MMSNGSKPNAATQAKKRWNEKNYTQVKAHINPDVAASFKSACAASGASMASVLSRLMAEYGKAAKKHSQEQEYTTRGKRRAAVRFFEQQLEKIVAAEEQCRDNTPENMQGSIVYEKADEYVSQLEEAIELLAAIY